MIDHLVFLTIPGLRPQDVAVMPRLKQLMSGGQKSTLHHSFPAVTWPSQATMLTGELPRRHGIVGNGLYCRETRSVEMWTFANDKIQQPQIWDVLHQSDPARRSGAWFPMLSKQCGADAICMPAPVHNPDGSETLWCYTRPTEYYGDLRERLGDFPLQHFWGPLANIRSTQWIVDSAILAASRFSPEFFYVYLPHLDYAAQKHGPQSPQAAAALGELDDQIGKLADGLQDAWLNSKLVWIAASEYAITPVDHVSFPNRLLREAGLLEVTLRDDGEHLDLQRSTAWAMVDHQFSHVFVRDQDPSLLRRVREVLECAEGIAHVVVGPDMAALGMDHERSGEMIAISAPNSWQAYYWWNDDVQAPGFARTVDIHRKPGYDPVELFFDPTTKSIPLDARLVRGSHGAPVESAAQCGVLLCSESNWFPADQVHDVQIAPQILEALGR